MLKKLTALLTAIMLIFTCAAALGEKESITIDPDAEQEREPDRPGRDDETTVTAQDRGFYNIRFDNGYSGYCADIQLKETEAGELFTEKDTSALLNHRTGEPVGNILKVFFVNYTDLFLKNTRRTQDYIWAFTDNYIYENLYTEEELNMLAEIRETAESVIIPDHGYTKKIDDRTTMHFDFIALDSRYAYIQNYFGVKISYTVTVNEGEDAELPNPFSPEDPTIISQPSDGDEHTLLINNMPIHYTIYVIPRPTPAPEAPSTPAPEAPSVPATGDGTPVALLAAIALASMTVIALLRRRRV